MAIVKEIQNGTTRIRIHDDCCQNMTDEQIQAVLKRIASSALLALNEEKKQTEQAG
jgi:hypothetical protein